MSLEAEIVARAREIKTDGYAMSIGEMLSMYRDGDLDVHPEFQRIFRWEDAQKWSLIESVLLGIPIPMIFVAQREDGVWDVIDGVQRLSTILEFVGAYLDDEGNQTTALRLGKTEYLPQLDGYVYESKRKSDKAFSEALRRDFKRARLEFRIIKKDSDPDAKFDLFQRLNSGTQLSAQESRNCLMVMINRDFYRWMVKLAAHHSFVEVVQLSEQKEDEGFRQELVLRFILQMEYRGPSKDLPDELGAYITEWVRRESPESAGKTEDWEDTFVRTFDILKAALGEDAFRKYESSGKRFLGAFSISAYEAIAPGVALHVEAWESQPVGSLADRIKSLWSDTYFKNNSGSGISPRRRTPRLINHSREFFKP